MKTLTFALCLLTCSVQAQFFSGELTYTKKFVFKKPGINVDSLNDAERNMSISYLITSHYYKSTHLKDGKMIYSYTYHDDTKRMYDEYADKDYISFRDSRIGNTSQIRTTIYKDSIKIIAGHRCFMVEGIYGNYIQKVYYATDLKIDPETFKGHEVGNWYNEIKAVDGALSLGSATEYATHIEINEVVDIKPRELKKRDFELPKKMLVASFSALTKKAILKQSSLATQACYRKKLEEAPATGKGQASYVFVSFIVTDKGEITNVEPHQKDDKGYYKIAVDIVSNCGLEFTPGQIDGKEVSALMYIPIEFR